MRFPRREFKRRLTPSWAEVAADVVVVVAAGRSPLSARANALSQNAVFYNDPGRMNTNLAKIQAVTAKDVQRVAQKYLVKENRVVVIVLPAEEGDGGVR